MKKTQYFLVAIVLLFGVAFSFDKDSRDDRWFNSHIVVNDVEAKDLTQFQLEEDFRALVSVLKNTGTDYLVDKRKYGEYLKTYENSVLQKSKGNWDVETLYDAIKKVGVGDRRHTYLVWPRNFRYYSSLCLIDTGDTPSEEVLAKSFEKNKVLASILDNGMASIYTGRGLSSPKEVFINEYITTKILEKDKIAYMKIPSFRVEEYMYSAIMTKFFADIEHYENFIIDIRGNSGGYVIPWMNIMSWFAKEDIEVDFYVGFRDTAFGEMLKDEVIKGTQLKVFEGFEDVEIKQIDRLPSSMSNANLQDMENLKYFAKITDTLPKTVDYDFRGKIYLLVDKGSFSSSDLFAYYAKQTDFATIVGNPTKGDGIGGFGRFTYPLANSGFVYEIQGTYGFNEDGSSNYESGTMPDVDVKGKSALDVTLELINKTK